MTELQIADIPCFRCEKKELKYISRAFWQCQACKCDNSIFVVLMYQGTERERELMNPTQSTKKEEEDERPSNSKW